MSREGNFMAKIILICGKIGSGKTTYAKKLTGETNAVLLSADELTLALFGACTGANHDEIVEKTQAYLFNITTEIATAGANVILDWGFMTREERQYATEFFASGKPKYTNKSIQVEWHYVSVTDEVLRDNLGKRNNLIQNGKLSFYFICVKTAVKMNNCFEEPTRNEIDVWIENIRAH
jgi:predicted kinase